jgi:hypothetical protein
MTSMLVPSSATLAEQTPAVALVNTLISGAL